MYEVVNKNGVNVIKVEDAHIMYRNFTGTGSKYNREGNRNFNLIIEDEGLPEILRDEGYNVKVYAPAELADQLTREGFNVKIRPSMSPDDQLIFFMAVRVNYGNERFTPKVTLIKNGVSTILDEESVGQLDYADINDIKLAFRPSYWDTESGKHSATAYVKEMRVTIDEDIFADDDLVSDEYPR